MEITASVIYEKPEKMTITDPIAYAHRETGDLYLSLVIPAQIRSGPPNFGQVRPLFIKGIDIEAIRAKERKPFPKKPDLKFPLVIIVPGSGFKGIHNSRQSLWQAVHYARKGYVAAVIDYRGTAADDSHFPGFVQDIKEAVRFLRKNASEYCIDPDRIAIQGSSSGGHGAAMAGFTDGDPLFDLGENLDVSSQVNAVICFFGPVDPIYLYEDRLAEKKTLRVGEPEAEVALEAYEIYGEAYEDDPARLLNDCSVSNHINPDGHLPALICLTGDEDRIIPLQQGLRLCQNVRDAGGRAEFYRVIGANHEECFFDTTVDLIDKFLKRFMD